MNDKQKLSIIIPTYNEEKDISSLLKCLEDQRLKNFEVIFIDGCSSDKTIEVLKEFKIQSKLEIKIYSDIRFDRNRARNFGIRKSKNEILVILNADVFLTNNFTFFISEFYSNNPKKKNLMINSEPLITGNYIIPKYYLETHFNNYKHDIYEKVSWTEGFSFKKSKKYFPIVKGLDLKGGEDSYFVNKKFREKHFNLSITIKHKVADNFRDFIKEKISRGKGNVHAHLFFLNKSRTYILAKVTLKLILNITLLKYYKVFNKPFFYKYIYLFFLEGICISLGEFKEIFNKNIYKKKLLLRN